jgi:nucleotide-binding universal stress UspA family protein
MDIKNILLVMRDGDACVGQLALAASLANAFDGVVEGVGVFYETEVVGAAPGSVDKVGDHAVRGHCARQASAAYAETLGVSARSIGWSILEGEGSGWKIVRQARTADLIIVAVPGKDRTDRRLVETLAIQSGAPCLLVPCDHTRRGPFDRVVLAWDGSREAKQAMDRGMPFMRRARAVSVVMVHEEGAEARCEAGGAALLAHLARHGARADLELIARPGKSVGETLIDQCVRCEADLLLIGAYGHHQPTGMVLGSATRTLLARAPLPVLMAH